MWLSSWIFCRAFFFTFEVVVMNKYIKFISPIVFLISIILLISFRQVPSGKLWNEYNVLYVPVESDDAKILSALSRCQISDVVSLSGQFLPVSLNENSIEISMLRLNYGSKEYEYTTKRNAFFFDKASAYRLYYIPAEYKSKLSDVVNLIESNGIPCGTDTSASYPWLLPVVSVLLAVILLLFVNNKLVFICSTVIPLIFLFSNPFYPVATATCLVLLCLFFSANVWRRRGAVSWLISRRYVPAMLGVAAVCAFAGSVISGFWFFVAFCGTAGVLLSIKYAEDFIRSKKPFVPVFIRPAKSISIFAGKALLILGSSVFAAILVIAIFFLTSTDTVKSKSSKLLLPASSSIKNDNLPQLEDYYRWNWNVRTAPYKSLNENQKEVSDYIEFDTFSENSETGIITTHTNVMSYDDDFRKEIFESVDSLKFNSIEKVMKSEGADFSAGYSALSSSNINLFGIIMMFICVFILLFIYISIIIRKGINK